MSLIASSKANLPNLRRLFVEARTDAEESAYSRNARRGAMGLCGQDLKGHLCLTEDLSRALLSLGERSVTALWSNFAPVNCHSIKVDSVRVVGTFHDLNLMF
ncbi:hypothetical protein VTL71DRAFT_11813 [Oculimacula yallundae]|uniref:Uncharacterized protein n=1 Tax=Oculimacula yallundae TaxID=86028 RepID=A0ABR4CRA6_9HELO